MKFSIYLNRRVFVMSSIAYSSSASTRSFFWENSVTWMFRTVLQVAASDMGMYYLMGPNTEINSDGYFAENCWLPSYGVDPD